MVSPLPNKKKTPHVLPSQVTSLGEALRPVMDNLRQAMSSEVESSGHEFVTLDDLSTHIRVIKQALTHLSPWLEDLRGNVIKNENAGMPEAYRAAGRLEQVLSELTDGYHEAHATHSAGPDAIEARELVLGVYRHILKDICDWLEELVQVIADPMSASKKQGISLKKDVVELTVVLNLTTPPEFAKIEALTARLKFDRAANDQPIDEAIRPGALGTIGALAFGLGLADVLKKYHD